MPRWLVRRRYLFYAWTLAPVDRIDGSSAHAALVRGAHRKSAPVTFALAEQPDLAGIMRARPRVYELADLQRRLRDGHLALIGRHGESIIHIRWIFRGAAYAPYLLRRLVLAPGEAFLDEVYTVPAWRRKGVETAAAMAMRDALGGVGVRRVYCAIASWNRVPQRVAEALGYERIGAGGYWNLGGLKRFFWDGALQDSRDGLVVGTAQRNRVCSTS
jgi:RimJ/RimL family protein N-acetyltransferase